MFLSSLTVLWTGHALSYSCFYIGHFFCLDLHPPSFLPVEIVSFKGQLRSYCFYDSPNDPVRVFEHRAPFNCMLDTWCHYRFPLHYLVFFFFKCCFKKFSVYCLASLTDPSILVGRHLGAGGWSSPYSQVQSAQPQSQENCFPLQLCSFIPGCFG